uniref:Putative cytochrome P450 n=1 Tax=Puccinia horiana TaxID=331382 RepID=W8FWS3_9BASI|nr:putative cytochrome P450 [Puccinia horiana]
MANSWTGKHATQSSSSSGLRRGTDLIWRWTKIPDVVLNFARPLELGMTRHLKFRPGWSVTMPGLRLIDISQPEWLEHVQKTTLTLLPINLRSSQLSQLCQGSTLMRCSKSAIFPRHLESVEIKTFAPSLGKEMGQLHQLHLPPIQSSSPSPDSIFVDAFDFAQKQLDRRFALLTLWKAVEAVDINLGKKIGSACKTLHDYTTSLIDERLASLDQHTEGYNETPTDLLGSFLRTRKQLGSDLGKEELKETFLNLIIAGRDSTAEALTWTFYHLLMNKDIVAKIREEASAITGKDRAGRVTYENNKEFKWAHAVILEALRLHPSIPKADKIPGGPVIEAGDAVRWSDWAIARDPEVWGEDCLEFRPARWIDEKGNIKQFGQFKFHAFNCVSLIVEVFHNFELEFAPGWLEDVPKTPLVGDASSMSYLTPKYKPSLTLPMAQPMMVVVKTYQGGS